MAISRLTHVTIVVRDQDEALAWYQDKFGFEVVTDDSETIPGSRWLTVKPKEQEGLEIILFPAQQEYEKAWVGQGALWVLETDDCRKTCEELEAKGVKILTPPQERPWAIMATVEDLYGNPFNLMEKHG